MQTKTTSQKSRPCEEGKWFREWFSEWIQDSAVDKTVFLILLLFYTGATLYLFVMQCNEVPSFRSDMPAYVDKVLGIEGEYSFPYPLFFGIAKIFSWFFGAPAAVAITTALLNSLGIFTARIYMGHGARQLLSGRDDSKFKRNNALDLTVTFLTFALFLLGNLYSPKNTAFFGFDYAYRCMGIYTPNPIWNATYMATRVFAIVCFFEGCRILGRMEELSGQKTLAGWGDIWKKFPWREALPFALSLFLTTITKPSFTMVVLPVIALILLIQVIRTKGSSIPWNFALCVMMIPTGIDLLYQFFGVFSGANTRGEETGIGFAFAKVWGNYSGNIPLSILMGMALPIGVLVLNLNMLKNAYYRFACLIYLVGMAMFLCLYEKGFRMLHANFSWGYMHGMFFVYFLTLLLMLKNTIQWRKSYKMVFVLAEWCVFFVHLICGTNFFIYALLGKDLADF